jgi:hypothetical protein
MPIEVSAFSTLLEELDKFTLEDELESHRLEV